METYQNLISFLPYQNHAFQIKKSNWRVKSQDKLLKDIFGDKEEILINRQDLFKNSYNIERFILMTLMWGYPTKGRGSNIEKLLEETNFQNLCKTLVRYRNAEIPILDIKREIQKRVGLGISTITKFLYFLQTTIDGNRALILDNRLMMVINSGQYQSYNGLKGINASNAINFYNDYLKITHQLSAKLKVEPDQIEMFLFTFGRNLSKNKNNGPL